MVVIIYINLNFENKIILYFLYVIIYICVCKNIYRNKITWKPPLMLRIENYNINWAKSFLKWSYDHIYIDILYKLHNKMYSILSTYCPAKNVEKDAFWTYLNNCVTSLQFSWLLLGDFNETLSPQDKWEGDSGWSLINLIDYLLSSLIPMPLTSRASNKLTYSWTGVRNNNLIFERINMAISHNCFYDMFNISQFRIMLQSSSPPMKETTISHLHFDFKIFGL